MTFRGPSPTLRPGLGGGRNQARSVADEELYSSSGHSDLLPMAVGERRPRSYGATYCFRRTCIGRPPSGADHSAMRARAVTASSVLGGTRGAYETEASSRCARRFSLHANANGSLFRRHSLLASCVPSGCEGTPAAFSFPARLPPDVSPSTREPAAPSSPCRGAAHASDIYPVLARCLHSGRTPEATRTSVGGLWTS